MYIIYSRVSIKQTPGKDILLYLLHVKYKNAWIPRNIANYKNNIELII